MRLMLLPVLFLLAANLAAQDANAQPKPEPKPEPTKQPTAIEKWEDGAGKVDTPLGEFTLGGYATFQHKTLDRYNGGQSENFFEAYRIVPQFHWQIMDWLSFGMEVEFEGGGSGASFLTDNYILVEYAEIDVALMDEFNIKAGLLLVAFGRYNQNHDDIFWDLADRPFVARRVVPTAFDQPGVGIYGNFTQLPFFSFNYQLQVTQGFNDNFTNNEGARSARTSFRRDNNGNKAIWARLGITPQFDEMGAEFMTADFGLSYNYQNVGPDNTQATRGVAVDGALKFDILDRFGIDVTGEWARIWINRESNNTRPNGLWAYFVDVLFKFDPFPAAWRGTTFGRNPYIGLILRFEANDLNDDHVGTAARDDRIATTIGVSFRPITRLVFRGEFKHQQSMKRDDGDETRLVFSVSIGF
ncbi:MAG: hypothetical protein KF754_15855 [Planctomycetes bacterium]|nr:hypothetical protein [Planctomycetota bacterium]